jgi:hypothetical protein
VFKLPPRERFPLACWKTVPFNPRQRFPEPPAFRICRFARDDTVTGGWQKAQVALALGAVRAVCSDAPSLQTALSRAQTSPSAPVMFVLPLNSSHQDRNPPSLQSLSNISDHHSTLPRSKAMNRTMLHTRKAPCYNITLRVMAGGRAFQFRHCSEGCSGNHIIQ